MLMQFYPESFRELAIEVLTSEEADQLSAMVQALSNEQLSFLLKVP